MGGNLLTLAKNNNQGSTRPGDSSRQLGIQEQIQVLHAMVKKEENSKIPNTALANFNRCDKLELQHYCTNMEKYNSAVFPKQLKSQLAEVMEFQAKMSPEQLKIKHKGTKNYSDQKNVKACWGKDFDNSSNPKYSPKNPAKFWQAHHLEDNNSRRLFE